MGTVCSALLDFTRRLRAMWSVRVAHKGAAPATRVLGLCQIAWVRDIKGLFRACPQILIFPSIWSHFFYTAPSPCSPGSFSENGLTPCTLCPVGAFQNSWSSTQCIPCPEGSSTTQYGTKSRSLCLSQLHNFSAKWSLRIKQLQ